MNTTDMDEADFVECACPHCGQSLSFPVNYVGTPQLCIRCSELCLIPIDGAKVAGKLPFPITSERLILRRFVPIDWKDVLEVMSDDEIWRYQEQETPDDETVIGWLEQDAKGNLNEGKRLAIALELKTSGKIIGNISMWYNGENFDEIGFDLMIHRDYRKQGFATEALRAFFKVGFDSFYLHRITASCDSRATAFGRALERAGMRREGEFVQDRRVKGDWANTVWFAILASEPRST